MKLSQQRPNTVIPFRLSSQINLSLPAISLQSQGIVKLLQHYSDPKLVDVLTLIAAYGAWLGYEGSIDVKI